MGITRRFLSGEIPVQKISKNARVVCPTCQTTYEEFVKNSCFGCEDCYNVFDVLIHDNIKKLQGSDVHTGKRPRYQGEEEAEKEKLLSREPEGTMGQVRKQIATWERKLREALSQEDYETAAVCRDQIRALKEEKSDE